MVAVLSTPRNGYSQASMIALSLESDIVAPRNFTSFPYFAVISHIVNLLVEKGWALKIKTELIRPLIGRTNLEIQIN